MIINQGANKLNGTNIRKINNKYITRVNNKHLYYKRK